MGLVKRLSFPKKNTRSLSNVTPFFLVLFLVFMVPVSTSAFELKELPFSEGETFNFVIKKFGIKAGTASLAFQGKRTLDGRNLYLITFTSKALNFFDEEKIYVDPATFYPVAVHRDLNIFGKKEKIFEEYLGDQGEIKVTKHVKGKTTVQTIKKNGPVDNIYCFIYRFRMKKENTAGETFFMNLPTKDIDIKLVGTKKIRIKKKKFDALYLKSVPKKYKVWIDTGQERMPLRIDGSVGLMNTSMFLDEYRHVR